MFNYDVEKKIATITTNPLKFDIDDLVGDIQLALNNALEKYHDNCIDDMNADDYQNLCNLIFEKAKYIKYY